MISVFVLNVLERPVPYVTGGPLLFEKEGYFNDYETFVVSVHSEINKNKMARHQCFDQWAYVINVLTNERHV